MYLRDKALMFNDERTGFVMYAVQGRTWVAMGDPVGPDEACSDLIRRFLERCDDFGGIPVFYEVGRAQLHRYADFGLTFVKLGEEARVDLGAFSSKDRAVAIPAVDSPAGEGRRAFRGRGPSGDVRHFSPQLRAVSDDWLPTRPAPRRASRSGTSTRSTWRGSRRRGPPGREWWRSRTSGKVQAVTRCRSI